jgi:hypothetical protein
MIKQNGKLEFPLETELKMFVCCLIVLCSAALLVYWLRYTCFLLLNCATADAGALADVGAQFNFDRIRQRLDASVPPGGLTESLERDYQRLTYLLQHASGLRVTTFEDRLLLWDFHLMRCWYAVAKIVVPVQARKCLAETLELGTLVAARMTERAGVIQHARPCVRFGSSAY